MKHTKNKKINKKNEEINTCFKGIVQGVVFEKLFT